MFICSLETFLQSILLCTHFALLLFFFRMYLYANCFFIIYHLVSWVIMGPGQHSRLVISQDWKAFISASHKDNLLASSRTSLHNSMCGLLPLFLGINLRSGVATELTLGLAHAVPGKGEDIAPQAILASRNFISGLSEDCRCQLLSPQLLLFPPTELLHLHIFWNISQC